MMTSVMTVMAALMAASSHTKNPVKLSMLLMCLSASLFFMSSLSTGQVWFPTLMFLMFMGGILMMFMILSSILPNENPGKTIMKMAMSFMLTWWILRNSYILGSSQSQEGTKGILSLSLMMIVMFTLISMYFFTVIMMAKSTESPLRLPVSCQKND